MKESDQLKETELSKKQKNPIQCSIKLSGVLIWKKSGNIFDIILKKHVFFSFIYVD